ncbi:MAG: hypothetical protein KY475_22850, partial [Planctomycetes bacterium]|nr:hypothetical protein [Planctomycetota bacterium]
ADSSADWLERSELEKVLAERELAALSAAGGVRDRVALGETLKADVLVILQTRRNEKDKQNYADVVAAETAAGLRLVAQSVLLGRDAAADADAVAGLVEQALQRRKEEITHVFAIPPFVSHDLTYEFDHLKAAYAKLLEQTLLKQPGVLVVELEEARSLAREFELAHADGRVARRLPMYLLGEYRHEGRGEDRRVAVTVRVQRGQQELETLEKTLPPAEVAEYLRQQAASLLAAEGEAAPVAPDVEARQLAERAARFLKLGDWSESLSLIEASLLLTPEQPELRSEAVRAGVRLAGKFDPAAPEARLAAFHVRRRAFEHFRELALRHDLKYAAPHLSMLRGPAGDDRETGSPVLDELMRLTEEQREEERSLLMRLIDRCVEEGTRSMAGYCLNRIVEGLSPHAAYEVRTRAILRHQDRSDAGSITRTFAHHGYTLERVGTIEGRQFLKRLSSLPEANAEVRDSAKKMLEELGDWGGVQTKSPAAKEESDSKLTFQPLNLTYRDARGSEQKLAVSGCIPLDNGIDVVWSTHRGVFALSGGDRVRPLWLAEVPNTRIASITYDGRYVWFTTQAHGQAAGVWVLDPVAGETWQIKREHGLPLLAPKEIPGERYPIPMAQAAAIAEGQAIIVGWIGRTWVAKASFDPQGEHAVKIFHEAKEPQPRIGDKFDVLNPDISFLPSYAVTLGDPHGDDTSRQLVLIGRGAGRTASNPLVVDPQDLSVRILDHYWYLRDGSFGPDPGELVHGAYYYVGVAAPRHDLLGLYRTAASELKSTLITPNLPEGHLVFDGKTVNVVGKEWRRGKLGSEDFESLGAVPWIYFNRYGLSPRDDHRIEKGDIRLETLTYSQHHGILAYCREEDGPSALVRVLFDGSGVTMDQALHGKAGAVPEESPAPEPAELAAGPRLPAPPRQEVLWERGYFNDMKYSPDGKLIVTAGTLADRAVQLWDAADGRLLADLLAHEGGMEKVAFSPSGRYFATGADDGLVVLWSTRRLEPLHRLTGHERAITDLAFSWDEQWLASAGMDRKARVWSVAGGEERLYVEQRNMGIRWVGFTPDGDRLVTAADGRCQYWDLATGRAVGMVESLHRIVGFLPDRTILAAVDNAGKTLIAWDCGEESSRTLWDETLGWPVAVSPDGRFVVTLQRYYYVDGERREPFRLRVWEIASHREVLVHDSFNPTAVYGFSADSKSFFATGGGRLVRFPLEDAPQRQARTWTDSTGRHRTQATLLDLAGGAVRLEKSGGDVVSVPLERLSRSDQQYVREQLGRMKAAGAASEND